jgi:hypothetical protein
MSPQGWPHKNPETVDQQFNVRHSGAGMTLTNSFMWAVWAAAGSDYLEKLDALHPAGPVQAHPELLDISHVRWATGNAITAIDLCAATMGHLFCRSQGGRELSLRDFDAAQPPRHQAAIQGRRALLPPEFLKWVWRHTGGSAWLALLGKVLDHGEPPVRRQALLTSAISWKTRTRASWRISIVWAGSTRSAFGHKSPSYSPRPGKPQQG